MTMSKMVSKGIIIILVILCAAILTGCVAARHAADTQEGLQGDKLTVGTVQKEIRQKNVSESREE